MRRLSFSILALSVMARASAACTLPAAPFSLEIDLDGDGQIDCIFQRVVTSLSQDKHRVSYPLDTLREHRLLRASASRLHMNQGEVISSATLVQSGAFQVNTIVMTRYDLREIVPGVGVFECTRQDGGESLNQFTDALLGLRLNLDDGPHYGWIRFTRPDTEPSTPFTVAGYNYHPLPNEPIGAGLPPTPPPVTPTFDATEGTLSLNWDARFPGLVLEATESLTEPVEWKPVPDPSGPPAVLPVPEGDRFYRLRNP